MNIHAVKIGVFICGKKRYWLEPSHQCKFSRGIYMADKSENEVFE